MKKPEHERLKEPADNAISRWKDIFEILKSVSVILGIIGTGYWFYQQGEVRPRADVSHEITHRNINNKNWVHVLVIIKNIGKTPINIEEGNVNVQQVIPPDNSIKKDIDSGKNIVDKKSFIVLLDKCMRKRHNT